MANVMFDRSTIEAEITTLQALVDSVAAEKGNAAERLANATLSALSTVVDIANEDNPMPAFPGVEDGANGHALGDLAIYVRDVSAWAEQVANEAVQAIVRKSGAKDNTEALVAQYRDKVENVKAMLTLAKSFKVDTTGLEIPALRGGTRSAGTPRRQAGVKQQLFYRVLANGERRDQSDNQNSLSSMAWYYGKKITGETDGRNSDRGIGAKALETWLEKNVDGYSRGKPWSTVIDGVTYGMDVVDPAANEEE